MIRPTAFSKIPLLRLSRQLCRNGSSSPNHLWIQPEGFDTGVKVFNCVAREKVPLIVRNRSLATFYTCGPTVYDETHLGHASCYVKLDILQRLLRDYFGLPLLTAMNITDIDDKIIRRGQETGREWQEISREYEQKFWLSLHRLGVLAPDCKVRVTDHLPQITTFIQKLLDTGHAYLAADSSVYFDCASHPGHGKVSHLQEPAQDSPETKSLVKKSSRDFALWKAVNSGPAFQAGFGVGRPGWHIECSAMASEVFGSCIDFHGGGWDLKFPHHENEESQSCAFHTTQQWVNYWLHTGQLRLEGASEKMSKSLQNTISVGHFLEKYSANDFRMFCLLSNYRSSTEYSDEGIEAARRVFSKFTTFAEDLHLHLTGQRRLRMGDNTAFRERLMSAISDFDVAIRDDFDTARAIKVLIDLVGVVNRSQHGTEVLELDSGLVNLTQRFFEKQLRTFGLHLAADNGGTGSSEMGRLNTVIESVLEIRSELRRRAKSGNDKSLFFLADRIRKQLAGAGIEIKDREKQTTTWSLRE